MLFGLIFIGLVAGSTAYVYFKASKDDQSVNGSISPSQDPDTQNKSKTVELQAPKVAIPISLPNSVLLNIAYLKGKKVEIHVPSTSKLSTVMLSQDDKEQVKYIIVDQTNGFTLTLYNIKSQEYLGDQPFTFSSYVNLHASGRHFANIYRATSGHDTTTWFYTSIPISTTEFCKTDKLEQNPPCGKATLVSETFITKATCVTPTPIGIAACDAIIKSFEEK